MISVAKRPSIKHICCISLILLGVGMWLMNQSIAKMKVDIHNLQSKQQPLETQIKPRVDMVGHVAYSNSRPPPPLYIPEPSFPNTPQVPNTPRYPPPPQAPAVAPPTPQAPVVPLLKPDWPIYIYMFVKYVWMQHLRKSNNHVLMRSPD